MKQFSQACERNRDPILGVLRARLPTPSRVLEVASGTGMHAVHISRGLPNVIWQPSDRHPQAVASIEAWTAGAGLQNLLPVVTLDVCDRNWDLPDFDAVFCSNMVHQSAWAATEGMFRGASRVMAAARRPTLILYGPYRFDGEFTAESNARFDKALRERNPEWGVRDVVDLDGLARMAGLQRVETIAMPANNHCLVYHG